MMISSIPNTLTVYTCPKISSADITVEFADKIQDNYFLPICLSKLSKTGTVELFVKKSKKRKIYCD